MSPRASLLALASAGLLGAGFAGGPAAAEAATRSATSSNWAGYAISRSGVRYRHVSGTWVQPAVDCSTSNGRTYSAMWVGLGGLSQSSRALEQIGTEADCSRGGSAAYSAWYELVPQASVDLSQLRVHAGDTIQASVDVRGTTVQLKLADLTSHRSFKKTTRASQVDTSSAEWIVEAPALCFSSDESSCSTEPLANFGTASFSSARAATRAGHIGTVIDPAWTATKISLDGSGAQDFGPRRFASAAIGGSATPGDVSATGASFTVSYSQATAPSGTG